MGEISVAQSAVGRSPNAFPCLGQVLQLADSRGMALMLLRIRARRVYAHEESVSAAILIPHRVSASFRFVLALLWAGGDGAGARGGPRWDYDGRWKL